MKRKRVWIIAGSVIVGLGILIAIVYSIAVSGIQTKVLQPDLTLPTVFIPNQTWFCNTVRSNGGLAHLVATTQADPSDLNLMTLKIATVNSPIPVERTMATIYRDVMAKQHPAAVHVAVNQVEGRVPC